MAFTVNTKTYNLDTSLSANAAQYIGPANTFAVKDTAVLKRTPPKATATFSGVARSSLKFTKTVTLTGALTTTGDAIVEVSMSLPVGCSEADADSICQDVGDLLITSTGNDLYWNHKINP